MSINIKIEIAKGVDSFLEKTQSLLSQREAEYSLQLGLCVLRKANPKNPDDYVYITVSKDGHLVGAAVLTERALIVSALEEPLVVELVRFLKEKNINFSGVVGPAITSEALIRIFGKLSNQKFRLNMGQKIYALTEVTFPENVEGQLSLAKDFHKDLVGQWLYEFSCESLPNEKTTLEKTLELADGKIKKGEVYLWLDQGGNPVSMNLVGRPTENGISVSGVYTPKNLRKRGYASGVVAGASQKMLDSGKQFCVLYTDVANPTSNKIYQQIGYKEIATSKYFVFGGAL